MRNKTILIGIGILAVGLLALPQTLALFIGQHDWYDTTNVATNGVPCSKCHADVVTEMMNAADGGTVGTANNLHRFGGTTNGNDFCLGCHMTGIDTVAGYNQGNVTGGNYHAAALPRCLDCHNAPGVGYAGAKGALEIYGANEAHKPFVEYANGTNVTFFKGENEACIACHTHVAVDIIWTKYTKMTLNATEQPDVDTHKWVLSNFQAENLVIVKTQGNTTGNGTSIVLSGTLSP